MIGVIGALVALAVVLALVAVLAVRPPVRRATRALAVLRDDTALRLAALRALRGARRPRSAAPAPSPDPATSDPATSEPVGVAAAGARRPPSPAAERPSSIGGRGRHRRTPGRS